MHGVCWNCECHVQDLISIAIDWVSLDRPGHQLLPRQHDVAPYVAQQPAAPFGAHARLMTRCVQSTLTRPCACASACASFAAEPPGHVHAMIAESWAESTLGFSTAAGALPANLTFNAQRQQAGGLVLRAVNHGPSPLPLTVGMEGGAPLFSSWSSSSSVVGGGAAEASVSTLSGADLKADNSPSDVDAIAPQSSKVALGAGGKTLSLTLPGYSFTVAVL